MALWLEPSSTGTEARAGNIAAEHAVGYLKLWQPHTVILEGQEFGWPAPGRHQRLSHNVS